MNEEHDKLLDVVSRKQAEKLRSRREGRPNIDRGLGTTGVVGWSIATPTLLGVAVGMWLDRRSGSELSWTLMLLAVGLLVGCVTAWYWVRRELDRDR
ncbi:MAG TPA: AtpZ/AtpI family protein [Geminicoccaceae bacterium]|jgi:ATP synthase protein I|nr:AtpZ/AtpI family protein [Steroidobacteraceae bacterium]HLT02456.1 AtpZ/AtpI family protein [Geminicoccaceae bacterium]